MYEYASVKIGLKQAVFMYKSEQEYYEMTMGLHGEFLFADTIQEARLKVVTGQGYVPVDVIGRQLWSDTAVCRIPLVRSSEPAKKTYCAFWRKDIGDGYLRDFSGILVSCFQAACD